ncbi:MAG: MBL fold metallo-hydrolase [Chloroflexota bacterium]|nr:MBL fold metallo-hydrolase [Chloroflexota bacterium]MDE2940870.1 MBL fold metallo-hydrolase [Chloroflexota bacterium]MDE3268601.1 MBL fold metallo-hydrolase [Chloroflexota bacterium]
MESASTPWNRTSNPHLGGVEVITEGDTSGYGMALRFYLPGGREVGAVSLPHQMPNRTGPTWAYLVEAHGWTLIDAGPLGAMPALEKGLQALGRRPTDLERVVITHGHQDHDGNAYDLVRTSGAELWAHELYFHFLPYEYARMGLDRSSPLHRAIFEVARREEAQFRTRHSSPGDWRWRDHYRGYIMGHRAILEERLPIHPIRDGEELDGIRFLYTPGHAVDEICVTLDGVVFSGDHILPQITPHPTIKRTHPEPIQNSLPPEHSDAGKHYGLESYIRSLGRTLQLERSATVLPAHRLYNHGRFNVRNLRRAQEIVRHHVRRLDRLMESLDEGADTPEKLASEMFPPRKLTGGGFFSAVSEVVSHLELLADSGDVFVYQDGRIARNGSNAYRADIEAMTS